LSQSPVLRETPAAPAARLAPALIELSKPGVTRLVAITTLCGALTAPGSLGVLRLAAVLLGTVLVVAAANAVNMYLERDTDGLMTRTRGRPLPSGRITPEVALIFAAVTAVSGLALLAVVGGLFCAGLALAALVSYTVIYTPLKRVTPLSLHVGAVPGAIPPLIGWASVTGSLETLAWMQFAILLVWQLPHFLAIAVFRREEYARAGLRVLTVVRGVRRAKLEIAAQSLVLVLVSLLPIALGLAGIAYAAIALSSGLLFLVLATAGLAAQNDDVWARRVFFASMPYLVVVLGALAAFGRA